MGSYRELLVLKENQKLTDDAVKKFSSETPEIEAKVIKAKAIRYGVDPEWVQKRMREKFKDDPIVKEYNQRM